MTLQDIAWKNFKSFGKKIVPDALLKSNVQTPVDLRGKEITPKGTISLCFKTALAVENNTFFPILTKAGELQIPTNSISCKMWKNKCKFIFPVLQKSQ